ncbi:MAG: hypothetical protein ACWA5Q_02575 [bacterium]
MQRTVLVMGLILKHVLRGLLFSWPLYLIGLSAFWIPDPRALWLLVFLAVGVGVSLKVLLPGIRADYQVYVRGMVLRPGAIQHVLFRTRSP